MTVVDEHAETDESGTSMTEDLRGARPIADRARLRSALARNEQALFGAAAPARLGRFVLLGPIAGGGMGVVHGAYDPQLDRRVALKLLHPRQHGDPRARERLVVEARALARLDHPNVVPVHDVLVVEDQVVIVMELVAGETVAAWERAAPRSWREVAAIYLQAGRGLAAAHALGIVHRDFKPANAIVGEDGRVRVLDFGLARFDGAADPEAATAPSRAPTAATLTATGEVLGTVAFMAPEQLASGITTPASDQFSFCVALHGALHGRAPFAGRDVATLLDDIRAGKLAPAAAGRSVPAWLRAAVQRGLAADPAARHPSMAALLEPLGREHGWRRWRAAIAVAAIVAIAAAVVLATRAPAVAPGARCDGGAPQLAAAWNPPRRAAIATALGGLATPYARELGDRVFAGLDDYGRRWSAIHRGACVAHGRGALSGELLDRTMTCLDRRLHDLDSAAGAIAGLEPAASDKAVEVVAGMPPLSDCADREVLLAEVPPPSNPEDRRAVAALGARLSAASSLDRAGHSTEALAQAGAVLAEARQRGYPPMIVEAALLQGRILLSRSELAAAIEPLTAAETLAYQHRLYRDAVEAGARLLFADRLNGGDPAVLRGRGAELERLSAGLRGDRVARPLLLNNLGSLYLSAGDRARAQRYFADALAANAETEEPDLELATSVDMNLALLTPGPAEREAIAGAASQRLRDRLGAHHPFAIQVLYTYGALTADPARAIPRMGEACDAYRDYHPEELEMRITCLSHRAFLISELGDDAGAAAAYAEVVALGAGSTDADVAARRILSAGYEQLARGDPRAALARFAELPAGLATRPEWWQRKKAAAATLGAGLAARALGDDRGAIAQLERAVAAYDEYAQINEDVEVRERLALARFTLAALLRARGGADGERAGKLAAQAAGFYREVGPATYRRRLQGVAVDATGAPFDAGAGAGTRVIQ